MHAKWIVLSEGVLPNGFVTWYILGIFCDCILEYCIEITSEENLNKIRRIFLHEIVVKERRSGNF